MTALARPRITRRDDQVDQDALEIGNLYRKARQSSVESAKYNLQVGQKLIDKKKTLEHGEWNPWLLANKVVLGFETFRTAQRLMRAAAKCDSRVVFEEPAAAAKFNRAIWRQSRTEVEEELAEAERERRREPPPPPDYADECVAAVKKIIESTIDKMQRSVMLLSRRRRSTPLVRGFDQSLEGRTSLNLLPRSRFEALFAALTDTITDLQNNTLALEDATLDTARRNEAYARGQWAIICGDHEPVVVSAEAMS
jgi:hypothetical protein